MMILVNISLKAEQYKKDQLDYKEIIYNKETI